MPAAHLPAWTGIQAFKDRSIGGDIVATLEAIPTEYKGIVYRSKSEAMFARYLELRYSEEGDPFGVVYEPKHLQTLDGWVPDFLVWQVENTCVWIPQLIVTVYEYKPSKPTETYLQRFKHRCQEIQNRTDTHIVFCLLFGSVFSSERGSFWPLWEDHPTKGHSRIDWLGCFSNEIKATRFDLVEAVL